MEAILIGFGSNQGDSVAVCRGAIQSLSDHPAIRVDRVSSLYRTAPVGLADQGWFVNGVLQGSTALPPAELMHALLAVERAFGRRRTVRWGPRTLDLDLLAYGDLVLRSPELTVPHARMHERRFVLVPLAEIHPGWVHPVLKKTARELLAELPESAEQDVQPMGIR